MAKNYTITNREYQNTGGYCMVSIFTVHDRAAQATRYVVCSDDALTWQSFDIITNDLPDGLDYNDVIIETHIYDTLTCEPCWDNPVYTMDDEKFTLFKYCEFEHYKNDYDNFGIITELTVDRLPAELYSTLDEEVITWHKEHGATVTTNGYQVWPSKDYTPNKNHSITIEGRQFYTAQVVDAYENKTYDQTIIFEEPSILGAPRVVDYYYGEPDRRTTSYYIYQWLDKGN